MVDLADVHREPVDINAHEAAISCIALNMQGTRLATASEKVRIINGVGYGGWEWLGWGRADTGRGCWRRGKDAMVDGGGVGMGGMEW